AWQRGVQNPHTTARSGATGFSRLVDSVIRHESAGRVDAVSAKGALGLMQLMPETARDMAKELGVPFDLARLTSDGGYNKHLGSAYLNKMLERYEGDEALAVSAYNAGPSQVDGWLQRHGDPRRGEISRSNWVERIPFAETRNYATRILADLDKTAAPLSVKADTPGSLSSQQFKPAPETVAFNQRDRKSTRLNSSHVKISYAVFCLKK